MKLLRLWVGLTIGNFLYHLMAHQNWDAAIHATFMQGVALLAYFIIERD